MLLFIITKFHIKIHSTYKNLSEKIILNTIRFPYLLHFSQSCKKLFFFFFIFLVLHCEVLERKDFNTHPCMRDANDVVYYIIILPQRVVILWKEGTHFISLFPPQYLLKYSLKFTNEFDENVLCIHNLSHKLLSFYYI